MNKSVKIAVASTAALGASSAFAVVPTTVGELAASVDFTTVGSAILAVSATAVGLYVVWKGASFVIRAVKGA